MSAGVPLILAILLEVLLGVLELFLVPIGPGRYEAIFT
jgi:hypothetical protein